MRFIDLTGQKFNRLTVLRQVPNQKWTKWECRCTCGKIVQVRSCHIISGNIKSCGCWNIEAVIKRETKHGFASRGKKIKEYNIWQAMKSRCLNPNNCHYHNYGGRGITIWLEWMHDFEQFYKDMGPRPSDDHSIERINNDGNYGPLNCRWATREEQQRNTRQNRLLTHNGETKTITDWAADLNTKQSTLQGRLRRGWSIEKTLTTPILSTWSRHKQK